MKSLIKTEKSHRKKNKKKCSRFETKGLTLQKNIKFLRCCAFALFGLFK